MVPGLAGMARMRYTTFAFYNVAGGALWATAMVLIGYLAGASWQRAAHLASRVGLVALALLALGFALSLLAKVTRRHGFADRLAATAPASWVRRRFPAQLGWLRRRLAPGTPDGLRLTVTLVLAALCAWMFAGLTYDVLAEEDLSRLDPRVQAFVLAHRTGWLTLVMGSVTWLGSSIVLVPLYLIVTVALLRRWLLREALYLWSALLGAVVLYKLGKQLVNRPRPPVAELITPASGPAFPSGHATQAIVGWGMLAVVLLGCRSSRARAWILSTAAVVVLLVGASRVYLGAHWLTDVLGGYALGGCWLAVILTLYLRRGSPRASARPAPDHKPSREPGRAPDGAADQIPPGGSATIGS
jgi:undecaprenyl-diphosphatase